jgi:hypothetical protein
VVGNQITHPFVNGTLHLNLRGNPPQGWHNLPEVVAAKAVREAGCVAVRLFLTFTSAMDYGGRPSTALWQNSANRLLNAQTNWIFDPDQIATSPFNNLRRILKQFGVSQKHLRDAAAWRAIGEAIRNNGVVRDAIFCCQADVQQLKQALDQQVDGCSQFPLLQGPKVREMWVRMLAYPGNAHITNLNEIRVAVDIQVHRVTYYVGLTDVEPGRTINDQLRQEIQTVWRDDVQKGGAVAPPQAPALANTAGALDPALWFVGKWGCTYCEQNGYSPIATFCENHCRLRLYPLAAIQANPDAGDGRPDATNAAAEQRHPIERNERAPADAIIIQARATDIGLTFADGQRRVDLVLDRHQNDVQAPPLGIRRAITLHTQLGNFEAGVRRWSAQDPRVYICPDLRDENGARTRQADVLLRLGIMPGQDVNLQVHGNDWTIL